MQLLYFILVAYGLTQLLCFSKILDRIRPKHYFFSCPMCIGFWVGVFLWGINPLTELFTFGHNPMDAFLLGWLSSGTSYALNMIICDDGIQIGKGERYDEVDASTGKTLLQG